MRLDRVSGELIKARATSLEMVLSDVLTFGSEGSNSALQKVGSGAGQKVEEVMFMKMAARS